MEIYYSQQSYVIHTKYQTVIAQMEQDMKQIKKQQDNIFGTNEYGEIYENMKLYDEYEEEYCTIEFDETDCNYVIVYYNAGIVEKLENLNGLRIVNEEGTE